MSETKSELQRTAETLIAENKIKSSDVNLLLSAVARLEEIEGGPINLNRPYPAEGQPWTDEVMAAFSNHEDLTSIIVRAHLAEDPALNLDTAKYGALLRFISVMRFHEQLSLRD